MRKYDLLAISLLVFSAIVVTAMSVDPNHFSIKDWQPLMAAFVALGAAGVAHLQGGHPQGRSGSIHS
jgi:hypothetical protein